MTFKLNVTELAERDLDNICDYISNGLANPTATRAFLDAAGGLLCKACSNADDV